TISTNMSAEGALTNQRLRRDISSQSGVRRVVSSNLRQQKEGSASPSTPREICIACVLLGGTEGGIQSEAKG
ncbi:hypothetical protein Hamer_G030423, partial [Homarus americanus]